MNKLLLICSAILTTGVYQHGKAQNIAIKTNLLYWGTSSPNFALEMALTQKWTLEASVGWNPWTWNNGMSLRHWSVQPEARYWLCCPFEGHFFGAHAIFSKFNVGKINFLSGELSELHYKGRVYGGGISYGCHFPLGGRWGLETTLGIGFLRFDYDKYRCEECNEYLGSYKRNYFGLTKTGVSLIYMFN